MRNSGIGDEVRDFNILTFLLHSGHFYIHFYTLISSILIFILTITVLVCLSVFAGLRYIEGRWVHIFHLAMVKMSTLGDS